MRKPVDEFRHESVQDQQSIAKYLDAISEGLRSGRLSFRTNGEELLLGPTGLMDLEVKAKRTDDRSRITLRMSWSNQPEKVEAAPLIIEPGEAPDDDAD